MKVLPATILFAAALAAAPAAAHRLNVFAWVEAGEVVVEAKFASGARAKSGTVRVFDADERLVRSLPLGADGSARFDAESAESGLRVEVEASEGHVDYWILTPADLAGAGG